jgi:hypothetical protein
MEELSKLNVTKSDRIMLIGDMEHNTTTTSIMSEFGGSGISEGKAISRWYKKICDKADSCIVINPKEEVGNDITCEFIKEEIPVCFTGAADKPQEGNSNHDGCLISGAGLRATVDCLRKGMMGTKTYVSKRVLESCKKGTSFKVLPEDTGITPLGKELPEK